MSRRMVRIAYILITVTLVNEMSTSVQARDNNKRRTKDKAYGFQKNICDVTDRDSKVHCYCENSREPRNATMAECWVFNGGIPRDDHIWESFASQPGLEALSFNVRVDGALAYVPTKSLQYLQKLKSLNVKYGNIVEMNPFAFANLTNLQETTLSSNQIETLKPYAFAHLPNLTVLNLEENIILEINKDSFFDLPKLQRLVLTKNNITTISNGAFQHTFNLLELELNENNIHHLNRHTFDGLANLRKLDLRKNRIHNLTEFTFAELWNLQELLLGMNYIKFISERAFDGLSQLQQLSLDNNKLASLPSGLFEGVRGLSSLDLRLNDLHTLTFDNIKPILDNLKPSSSNLQLEENKFVCDCRLKWMYSLRIETKSQNTKDSLDRVTCTLGIQMLNWDYNNFEINEDDGKTHHKLLTVNNNSNISTKKSEMTKNELNMKKIVKKIIHEIPAETLVCLVEKQLSTATPTFMVESIKPIQNQISTFRLQQMNAGSAAVVGHSAVFWSILLFLCV